MVYIFYCCIFVKIKIEIKIMKSFTDIGQFRDVIRGIRSHHDYSGKDENGNAIYQHLTPYPTLKFRGTVKLHGTNSSIVKYKSDGRYEFQARERVLSFTEDNAGFMINMLKKPYQKLFDGIEFNDSCAIYGEWCGMGIQRNVAITQLSKRFVIFAVRIDDVYMKLEDFVHLKDEQNDIYNILQFPHFYLDIDFNNPELAQNQLIDLTMEVEKQCPVGLYFGVDGIGEGIVWEYIDGKNRYIFKIKGERHQNSKVKTLTTVDVEVIQGFKNFVDYAVTENRLLQGIDKMRELNIPIDIKSTSDYLRWVYNDVIKEEMDTMVANGIDPKKVGSYISSKSRIFWLNYLNSNY